jgi:hypothetical protein
MESSKGKEPDCCAYFYLVESGSFNHWRGRCDVEEREKKPDAGTTSGSPQKKIVYVVLVIAVVILAVVLIAKFGYNVNLLNPASGEMSLIGRHATAISKEPSYSDLNNNGNAGNINQSDDSQLSNTDLQQAMQKQQQSVYTIINVSKSVNDTAMTVIQNIK